MSTVPPAIPPALRTDDPAPVPVPSRRAGYIECDFCHCKLTQNGEVYQVGEEAKNYRDQKEKHEKAIQSLNEQIADKDRKIADKDREIAELKAKISSAPEGGRIGRL